jgi:hypothetical protein
MVKSETVDEFKTEQGGSVIGLPSIRASASFLDLHYVEIASDGDFWWSIE